MSQQLTVQQLEHACRQYEALRDAKQMEVDALSTFQIYGPHVIGVLIDWAYVTEPVAPSTAILRDAAVKFLSAKLAQSQNELEVLKLQTTALRSQQSGIVVPR